MKIRKNHNLVAFLKKIRKMNNFILYIAVIISSVSLSTIYSVTLHRKEIFFFKEIIWIFFGILVYLIFSFIDYRLYSRYYKMIYGINTILLILVFLIGIKKLGATRWIDICGITIQPSEISKLFLVMSFSEILNGKFKDGIKNLKELLMTAIHIVPIFILIAIEPDLGTALVILFLYLILIFISGVDWKIIWIMGGTLILSLPIGYLFLLKDYQRERIMTFLNPESDLLGSGWNVMQSIIAIGSGGIFGKGFMRGTQSQLSFLPEAHTDFIGAVFLEERGIIGGIFLILLYITLIFRILNIGDRVGGYGKLLCYGISAIFFFQIIINLGMIMGVMPVTGLPLLLMSYGGTSFILAFAMLGIVQSVNIYRE